MPKATRATKPRTKKNSAREQQARRPRSTVPSAPSESSASSAELIPLRSFESGATMGFLWLDVRTIEEAIVSGLNASGYATPLAPVLASLASRAILAEWARQTERNLNIEVVTAPFVLSRHRSDDPAYRVKYYDQLLATLAELASLLDDRSTDQIGEVTGLPFTRFVKQQVQRRGTSRQREEFRKILARANKGKPGRPFTNPGERRDIYLARFVRHMQEGLAAVISWKRDQKRAGDYLSDDEHIAAALRATGWDTTEISIVLKSRTPRAAAVKFVAKLEGGNPRSIGAQASQGERLLARTQPSRPLR